MSNETLRFSLFPRFLSKLKTPFCLFNSKVLKEVVKDTDLSYILLETDAPYLTPEPYRGKRNDSSYVGEVAKTIGELKGLSTLDVSRATTENAEGLFDFSSK